jgi:hypothetical protein
MTYQYCEKHKEVKKYYPVDGYAFPGGWVCRECERLYFRKTMIVMGMFMLIIIVVGIMKW